MCDYLVSIIMPTYNRAYIIRKAIESCLVQSYKNIELVVIDDHSTDNTYEIIKEYKSYDDRIIYIRNETNKRGANVSRNMGIEIAKGDYITFCDSDDYLPIDSIKDRINIYAKKPELGVVYGNALCIKDGISSWWKYDDIDDKNKNNYLLEELSLCQQNTLLINAQYLKPIGVDESIHGWTDDALVLSIALDHSVKHCGKNVAVVVKTQECMTANKRNLYLGLKYLLDKYGREIVKTIGFKRRVLWQIRLVSNWFYYKETTTKNNIMAAYYSMWHSALRGVVKPYFRHYFE